MKLRVDLTTELKGIEMKYKDLKRLNNINKNLYATMKWYNMYAVELSEGESCRKKII